MPQSLCPVLSSSVETRKKASVSILFFDIVQIKQAFRQKSLQCHPDLCPPAQRESAEQAFREIAEAYSSLSKGQPP